MDSDLKSNRNYIKSEDELSDTARWVLTTLGIVLAFALALILLRQLILGPYYRKKNRIDEKVVIITGCNTGIGKETALELAKRGGKIYMACRDSIKCEAARLEIMEKSKNQNVFNRTLDLSSLESIQRFVEKFLKEETRLDILINNAGIMATPKGSTKDGFEQQFGVNHLGHFYLTNLLLDTLKTSAPSRIVVVSSAIYMLGRIKTDDINSEKFYSKFGAYAQSKLANILFTKHLAKLLDGTGVTVNCLHPGIVKTELSRHMVSNNWKTFISPIVRLIVKTPKAGAQTSIRLAIDPSMDKVSGHYYFDCYFRFPILPKGRNPQVAEWLWNISTEMTDLGKSKTNGSTVIEV